MTASADRAGKVRVIGILGGIAGGKSSVARLMAERGAHVVDADRIAHEVLARPAVRQALREAFGEAVVGAEGRVSAERLAELAFRSAADTARLNAIVHPPILAEMRERVKELTAGAGEGLVVLDAALLVETGLDEEMCDALLFVDAPEDVRRRRAVELRGLSEGQFRRREAAQTPLRTKADRADAIIVNTGTLDELRQQLEELWPTLVGASRSTH
jgi:dephospho-CoA kinase